MIRGGEEEEEEEDKRNKKLRMRRSRQILKVPICLRLTSDNGNLCKYLQSFPKDPLRRLLTVADGTAG